jgi:hypothetical protein
LTALHFLVEGQTEERFAKDMLKPHFEQAAISVSVSVIATNRVASGGKYRGGIVKFSHAERDIQLLLKNPSFYVTTLFDYYRLPADFPRTPDPQFSQGTAHEKVRILEDALYAYFGNPRFIPFLQLHEFEALLFAEPHISASYLGRPAVERMMTDAVAQAGSIEHINDGLATHPAARIEQSFSGYSKVADGAAITRQIGLARLREASPRLDQWLTRLETLPHLQV